MAGLVRGKGHGFRCRTAPGGQDDVCQGLRLPVREFALLQLDVQLIREDVRDLVALQNVQALETLFALLPFRVGSPLSLNALAEDLQVAYNTVKVWVEVMEVQSQLNVPAIQLVDTGEAYRRTGAGRQPLLIAPAARWLATLP